VRPLPPTLTHRNESGRSLPMLVWRFDRPVRAIASGPLGGGIGFRTWVINATVDEAYARRDPDVHLGELADREHLGGPGVGMLTAVDVSDAVTAADGGVSVLATVGLQHPTWAAAPDDELRDTAIRDDSPGTINLFAWIPTSLTDAALVNAVATATEAKAQALWEHGVEATGTASDALFVASAPPDSGVVLEPYGGPRSAWGARLARAVRTAVFEGARRWLDPRAR